MIKSQTMIIVAGCLLAGLVIFIGVSFFGVLLPEEQHKDAHLRLVEMDRSNMRSLGAPGSEALHDASLSEFTIVKRDSAIKTAGAFSTW